MRRFKLTQKAILIALAGSISFAASAGTVEIVLKSSYLLQKGNKALKRGDAETAERYFSRAIESNLSTEARPKVFNGMCVAKILKEEWDLAIENCDEAIRLRSNDWKFFNNRGNAHLGNGNFEMAIENYDRALGMYPSSKILLQNKTIAETRLARRNALRNDEKGSIAQL